MELVSLGRDAAGEASVVAYGVEVEEEAELRCGLLFVRAGLTSADLVLRDPATKERFRVRLPPTALRRKAPGYAIDATLEVITDG